MTLEEEHNRIIETEEEFTDPLNSSVSTNRNYKSLLKILNDQARISAWYFSNAFSEIDIDVEAKIIELGGLKVRAAKAWELILEKKDR